MFILLVFIIVEGVGAPLFIGAQRVKSGSSTVTKYPYQGFMV